MGRGHAGEGEGAGEGCGLRAVVGRCRRVRIWKNVSVRERLRAVKRTCTQLAQNTTGPQRSPTHGSPFVLVQEEEERGIAHIVEHLAFNATDVSGTSALAGCLVGFGALGLVGWWAGWLTVWLADWLLGWVADKLADGLVGVWTMGSGRRLQGSRLEPHTPTHEHTCTPTHPYTRTQPAHLLTFLSAPPSASPTLLMMTGIFLWARAHTPPPTHTRSPTPTTTSCGCLSASAPSSAPARTPTPQPTRPCTPSQCPRCVCVCACAGGGEGSGRGSSFQNPKQAMGVTAQGMGCVAVWRAGGAGGSSERPTGHTRSPQAPVLNATRGHL